MARDEEMNLVPSAIRQQQYRQTRHTDENDERLKLEDLGAAEARQKLRQNTDDQEVTADNEDCQRRPQHGRGRMDIDLRPSCSPVCQQQKSASDQKRT